MVSPRSWAICNMRYATNMLHVGHSARGHRNMQLFCCMLVFPRGRDADGRANLPLSQPAHQGCSPGTTLCRERDAGNSRALRQQPFLDLLVARGGMGVAPLLVVEILAAD